MTTAISKDKVISGTPACLMTGHHGAPSQSGRGGSGSRAAAPPAGGPTASGGAPKRSFSELTVVLGAMLAGVGLSAWLAHQRLTRETALGAGFVVLTGALLLGVAWWTSRRADNEALILSRLASLMVAALKAPLPGSAETNVFDAIVNTPGVAATH